MVFNSYAPFYDALYSEKDYEAECDFVEALFVEHGPGRPVDLLDLGCGTGGHALPLARRGYRVTGVDRSPVMLAEARRKAEAAEAAVEFLEGDIRRLDLGRTFDAVISMFAVVCYQTTTDDLQAAFATARRHLDPGHLFVFDGWFGPAVLATRPADRVKTTHLGDERLLRIARPTLDVMAHTVRVDYTVLRLQGHTLLDEVAESHLMRFLFTPEVELLCRMTGFELRQCCVFLHPQQTPTDGDWNVSWIARAV